MPTYIALARYTTEAMQSIKESPSRLVAARKAFKQAGGELKAFYITTGQYDIACIVDAPNDEAMARIALVALGALGNVRTETMRAFTEEEFKTIVGGLP